MPTRKTPPSSLPSNAITPRSRKAPGCFHGGAGRAAIIDPIKEPSTIKSMRSVGVAPGCLTHVFVPTDRCVPF